MEDLGIFTGNKKNITLAEINMSVGRAFAAAYWYGTYPSCALRHLQVTRVKTRTQRPLSTTPTPASRLCSPKAKSLSENKARPPHGE